MGLTGKYVKRNGMEDYEGVAWMSGYRFQAYWVSLIEGIGSFRWQERNTPEERK
jgi:hypothetical protein